MRIAGKRLRLWYKRRLRRILRLLPHQTRRVMMRPRFAPFGCLLVFLAAGCRPSEPARTDWPSYLGDDGRTHYSGLDQITPENAHTLEVAWTYKTGDLWDPRFSQIQTNPLIVDSVLYGATPKIGVFALEAHTGRELWRFDPATAYHEPGGGDMALALGACRGLAYWADGADRRLLFAVGSRLFAVDAATGKPAASFGWNGSVSLHEGLGRDATGLFITATTPGAVYKDLLILGARVSEGADAAPGHIRAYDIRTGKIAWVFHTIPQPGEEGYDTWPKEAYKTAGGANSWAGMSVDKERGIVYAPTGSASFDFWGGNRAGANLYANALLALDAATGKRLWHFQTVHHDLWDRDLPAPPTLVRVKHGLFGTDAVAQITKSGFVFLFDRETGAPLFPIEERPTPRSELPDEAPWPTQPFPTKPAPFARQRFGPEDANDLDPAWRRVVTDSLARLRSEGQFTPIGERGTIIFPGFDGGGEWGGAAADPEGILYVNANEMPWVAALKRTQVAPLSGASLGQQTYGAFCASCHGDDRKGGAQSTYPSLLDLHRRLDQEEVREIVERGRGFMPSFRRLTEPQKEALLAFLYGDQESVDEGALKEALSKQDPETIPYQFMGYHRFVSPEGYPAVKPPWGTLSAIDLNTGAYKWRIPLGEAPELARRGIRRTGLENYGGPIVTAGGVLFIAATRDEMLRAFDKRNGRLLWQAKLPAGGYATPATYSVGGRQYVVIACGGGKMGTPSGDYYVAFALPKQ